MPSEPPAAGEECRYASKDYWEERYSSAELFEWFMSYEATQPLLNFLRKDAAVLDVGCGTSRFLYDLRKSGHRGRLVGVDVVAAALSKLRTETCDDSVELVVGDCLDLESHFPDSSFDVVLDKGTIDALCCGGPDQVRLLCNQICRVLKAGGRFVSISHRRFEGDEGDRWLAPILDGLRTEDQSLLHVDIHHAHGDAPTIYIFTTGRHSKRRSRNRDEDSTLSIQIHDHDEEAS